MSESTSGRVAVDPSLGDWLAGVMFGYETAYVEYPQTDGRTVRLIQVKNAVGEWVGVEAAAPDGSGRVFVDLGFTIQDDGGSQDPSQRPQGNLDGRIRVRKMTNAPSGDALRLEPAETPRGFSSCPEHQYLGLKMAFGTIPGRKCAECGLSYLSDEEYQAQLEWLKLRGVTDGELPY